MGNIKDFLSFNRLLGPTLIKYIYWLSAAAIVLMCVLGVIGGVLSVFSAPISGIITIISSIIGSVIMLIWLRVFCEKILVTFLIEARLRELNQRMGGGR